MTIRRSGWGLLAWGLCACAGAHGGAAPAVATAHSSGGARGAARARASSAPLAGDGGALETLRTQIAAGDGHALDAVGLRLKPAGGAREMTGDAADDERVDSVTVVQRQGDSAAVLVSTSCGNAVLGTVRWDGARWSRAESVRLVSGMEPGRCGQTNVRAEPIALTSDTRREIAVVVVSEDVTGDSLRGPFLSVYQLRAHGQLATLLSDAPFGAMDDATGATTTGEYLVVEDVPAPRDLHVAIRPGRPGPGGPPASEIVRRRYALRGARLEMVQQTTESAE